MMVGFSFRGWGWLAMPVWVLCTGAGAGIVVTATGAGDRRPAGVGVLGAMAGMAVAAGLLRLLGYLLNYRRDRDGGWRWTDRHELFDVPVQDLWPFCLAGVALLAPLVGVGFVPRAAVEGMFCGWAVLLAVGTFVVLTWEGRPGRPGSAARSRRWDAVLARRRLPGRRAPGRSGPGGRAARAAPASNGRDASPPKARDAPAPKVIEGSFSEPPDRPLGPGPTAR